MQGNVLEKFLLDSVSGGRSRRYKRRSGELTTIQKGNLLLMIILRSDIVYIGVNVGIADDFVA